MTRDPRARWNDREPEDAALEALFERSGATACPPPDRLLKVERIRAAETVRTAG